MVVDHLSRLETPEKVQKHHFQIDDTFLDKQILSLSHDETSPWFADIANYLSVIITPPDLTYQQKKRFFAEGKHCFWKTQSSLNSVPIRSFEGVCRKVKWVKY